MARNGTFTATADMSDHSTGTNFTTAVLDVSDEEFGTADGRIVAAASTNGGVESPGLNGSDDGNHRRTDGGSHHARSRTGLYRRCRTARPRRCCGADRSPRQLIGVSSSRGLPITYESPTTGAISQQNTHHRCISSVVHAHRPGRETVLHHSVVAVPDSLWKPYPSVIISATRSRSKSRSSAGISGYGAPSS